MQGNNESEKSMSFTLYNTSCNVEGFTRFLDDDVIADWLSLDVTVAYRSLFLFVFENISLCLKTFYFNLYLWRNHTTSFFYVA